MISIIAKHWLHERKGQFIGYLVFLITFEALCQLLITVHNHTIANKKIFFPFLTSKYYHHHHHHYCYYHNWEMNGFDLVLSMVYLLQCCYSLHLFYILLLLFFIQIFQIEISSFFCSSNNVELLTLPSTNKKSDFKYPLHFFRSLSSYHIGLSRMCPTSRQVPRNHVAQSWWEKQVLRISKHCYWPESGACSTTEKCGLAV